MESGTKAAVTVALITVAGSIIVALINKNGETTTGGGNGGHTTVICPEIPAVQAADSRVRPTPSVRDSRDQPAPSPSNAFVWVPEDFSYESGRFHTIPGHWERKKADGGNTYVRGQWDTSSGRCVWQRGHFVK